MTPYSFGAGNIQDHNTLRVTAQIDQLIERGSMRSQIMKYTFDTQKWGVFIIPEWNAIRIASTTSGLCVAGPNGDIVGTFPPSSTAYEHVDNSKYGPKGFGPITDLQVIGNNFYAAGMSRQVYRRSGNGKWQHVDSGTIQELGSKDVAGFRSIDGLSENDIYAVGYMGEIWRCQKSKWQQLSSPTNVALHKVRVVREDLVYICGQNGTLLRGSGNQLEIIEHGVKDGLSNIWSMEWYNNTLYLVGDKAMYTLSNDDTLAPVDLGLGEGLSFGHLHANAGMLLSSGPKHVLYTTDGKKWNDITLRLNSKQN